MYEEKNMFQSHFFHNNPQGTGLSREPTVQFRRLEPPSRLILHRQ